MAAGPVFGYPARSNACSKSASRSRQSSIPTEMRTNPSVTPASAISCALVPEWIVLLGWQVSVSTPPNETAFLAILRCRRNSNAAGLPPFNSIEKIPPGIGALLLKNALLPGMCEQGLLAPALTFKLS